MAVIIFILRIVTSIFNFFMLISLKAWLNENPTNVNKITAAVLTVCFFINLLFSSAIL